MRKRIRALPGGTSASKTISILICLIALAQSDKTQTLTSVVSESFPHLRRGAMRDFLLIMKAHRYYDDKRWDRTNFIYTFETGSQIEFFSADQPQKLRGGRRDRLFINEANNIHFSAFEELEVRTKEFIFIDWNPTNEFWYYTELRPHRNDIEEVTLTYLDNEALDQKIVDSIEQRKNRKGWWLVYGLGQLGEVEGRIYTGWQIIEEIPHEAKKIVRGLDFGFSNDPTVIVDIYQYNGGFIIDELFYKKKTHNDEIARFLLSLEDEQLLVIADSAEPKSIAEIRKLGVNIIGAQKGKGSVIRGIDYVQSQKISVTKNSTNVIKCYRNYLWETDKDGKILNVPCHDFSDPMDAIRYGLGSFIFKEEDIGYEEAVNKFINGDKIHPMSPENDGYSKVDDYDFAAKNFINS